MPDPSAVVTIFYAWQSDSPVETNRNAIRTALNEAAANIETARPDVRLAIDEATRDMAGSQNIPDSIRLKIEACDIFVGDVTTINPSAPAGARRSPNPNVTFEIGYAAAYLGWARIILVLNTAIAKMDDLPFDFDRQRVGQFAIPTGAAKERKNLTALLTDAVTAILDQNPRRPAELKKISPEQIKRERDVANARWALTAMHITTLQQHIYDLPHMVSDRAVSFYEDFHAAVTSKAFHIYDPELDAAFRGLDRAWADALSPAHRYHANGAGLNIFSNPMDGPLSDDQEQDWNRVERAAAEMHTQLDRLLSIIRERYLEIHTDDTDREAMRRYVREQQEIEARFQRKS